MEHHTKNEVHVIPQEYCKTTESPTIVPFLPRRKAATLIRDRSRAFLFYYGGEIDIQRSPHFCPCRKKSISLISFLPTMSACFGRDRQWDARERSWGERYIKITEPPRRHFFNFDPRNGNCGGYDVARCWQFRMIG